MLLDFFLHVIDFGADYATSTQDTDYDLEAELQESVGDDVEYIDVDGEHGFGTILSWHTNPYDLYDIETNRHYAYIATEQGGCTYAHYTEVLR